MKMIYQCAHCRQMIQFGKNDFELELNCRNCKLKTCGKCLRRSHYPALCHEFEKWLLFRSTRPFQGTTILYNLLRDYNTNHWGYHNMLFRLLDEVQTAHEQFSPEFYQRFHKRLILPFDQMREVVDFNRWFLLHAAFNPVVESVLANEHNLLATRMTAFVVSVPPTDTAPDAWTARLQQVDMISIDLGVSVSKLIFGIPKAHNMAEVQESRKAVSYWESKMVS
ncbi:PREDICTED: uncharacterized protein LOC104732097 [Camelina sativa]|uniref:Uncharacterized protein LOC104732097 n=1 Tax=Camelina sativa TaxID=90675 RepID=A0ABM0V2R8_CAMSA|nr:PREDICTED: uncharacterized protein LOC104732097 [Camelina sativa]